MKTELVAILESIDASAADLANPLGIGRIVSRLQDLVSRHRGQAGVEQMCHAIAMAELPAYDRHLYHTSRKNYRLKKDKHDNSKV